MEKANKLRALTEKFEVESISLLAHYCKHKTKNKKQNQRHYICHWMYYYRNFNNLFYFFSQNGVAVGGLRQELHYAGAPFSSASPWKRACVRVFIVTENPSLATMWILTAVYTEMRVGVRCYRRRRRRPCQSALASNAPQRGAGAGEGEAFGISRARRGNQIPHTCASQFISVASPLRSWLL